MAKTYAAKPAKGEIETELLKFSSVNTRQEYKSAEIAKVGNIVFERDSFVVTTRKLKKEGGCIKFSIAVQKDGKTLDTSSINPITVKNPPVKVPDGTYRKETVHGEEVDIANMKEDPEEALKQIIIQLLNQKF